MGKKTFAKGQVVEEEEKERRSWQRYEVEMEVGKDVPASLENRFVISGATAGTLWLNYVSLFPPTFQDRRNGNRIDLVEKLAGLKPAFVVFPGGDTLGEPFPSNRFDWKATIGPPEKRMGHYSTWHYTSNGFGLLEFCRRARTFKQSRCWRFIRGRRCAGQSRRARRWSRMCRMRLDEIEYVTGDKSTRWGGQRAADGHPAPFPLEYVRIGNNEAAGARIRMMRDSHSFMMRSSVYTQRSR